MEKGFHYRFLHMGVNGVTPICQIWINISTVTRGRFMNVVKPRRTSLGHVTRCGVEQEAETSWTSRRAVEPLNER